MAIARMLHKKISISRQVSRLSPPAALLFTWMIPHADDEGRLPGDLNSIRGTVVPLFDWSLETVGDLLQEIRNQKLIYYWEDEGERYIEFINWERYQRIRKDRLKYSIFPKCNPENNILSDIRPTVDSQTTTQLNTVKSNKIKSSEIKSSKGEYQVTRVEQGSYIDPISFIPSNKLEQAAKNVWHVLEPDNPESFEKRYLNAIRNGISSGFMYSISREIWEDDSIEDKGAWFDEKVNEYLKKEKNL